MAESLQKSFNLLEDKEWLQSGIATLNDQMVGEKDIKTLANDMLVQIVEHTKSSVAALYILEEDKNLYLSGGYAFAPTEKSHKIAGASEQYNRKDDLVILSMSDPKLSYAYNPIKLFF